MIFVQQFLPFYNLKCKRWFPYKSNVHKEPCSSKIKKRRTLGVFLYLLYVLNIKRKWQLFTIKKRKRKKRNDNFFSKDPTCKIYKDGAKVEQGYHFN